MKDRVPTTDRSVSWRHQNCYYYTVLPAGREYTQLLRDFDVSGTHGTSQVLLDANLLADDSGYLELGLTLVSPDERLLAYSVDRTGDEVYELRFRDLETGADLADEVARSYYGGAWSADSSYFFYTVPDEAYRPFQVWRHAVGTSYDEDVLVLDEPDERFEINVRATRSGGLIVFTSESRDTSEVWVVDAHRPHDPPAFGRRSAPGRGVRRRARGRFPTGRTPSSWSPTTTPQEFRLARCPVPRDADQDHLRGSRSGPRTRASAWSASTRSRRTSC